MKRFLLCTYRFFHSRKMLFYGATVCLTAALALLASHIRLEEDITKVLPNGAQMQQVNSILRSSRFYDRIVIKIAAADSLHPEQLMQVADTFAAQVQQQYGAYVSEFQVRVEDETALTIYSAVRDNLPIYLSAENYRRIDTLIEPAQVKQSLKNDYAVLTSASGIALKRMIADDPVGILPLALRKLQSLQVDEQFDLYDGYIFSKDHRALYLFLTPAHGSGETKENAVLLEGIDHIIKRLTHLQPQAEILYYGGIPVAIGNARQLKKDTVLTLSITVAGILLFLGFFFRRKRVPLIMLLPVVFGGLFALAVIAVTQGSISGIALGAGSIILGIAINYSLHFFGHYKHCRSATETIADLAGPLTIGSFTTIASFFSLTLLQSKILNDFGLFAGWSLVGATVFTLVFLPHFLPPPLAHDEETPMDKWIERKLSRQWKHRRALFTFVVVLTIFFAYHARHVTFNSDMNQFNFMDSRTKAAEKEMDWMQSDTSKTVFIASVGKSEEDMLQKNEVLVKQLDEATQKGWVKKYASVGNFMPSESRQRERIERWNKYWTAEKKERLLTLLQQEGQILGFSATAFSSFKNLLHKQYTVVTADEFDAIRNSFGKEYLVHTGKGAHVLINAVTVAKADRPMLYALLGTHASTVILDKQVITNHLIDVIYNDFNAVLFYTSFIVFFALLLTYGRLELTLITFLPMLITWIWIIGLMALLGLQFNIINIIISTFIFGLGDDFGIFITDGLTRKFKEGKEVMTAHKTSIFLSTVTIVIGLGALIFAQHPALRSIAFIAIIGIFCVVFVGQTVQPALYDFFIQRRKEKGFAPWTFLTAFLFSIAFGYFVTVSLLAGLLGYMLIYLLPIPSLKKRKLYFHYLMCGALKTLTYMMVNVRKQHIGKETVDFSKPAIIIANHASFLDILVTVMQHPKLILLTNKWVYYSPVFGKVVQLADYYPVMEGVEPGIEKFAEIVKDGYSIVIFPEGTRSADGKLKRFHKGAFYLAEQLRLDIIPLLLHGTGDTIRKGDFMVMNSFMTMKFLPRITADDKRFGSDYVERTRLISRYFKEEYEKLRLSQETPRYFRQRYVMNYLYKGPQLAWKARWMARKTAFFAELDQALPKQGQITELGSSYGWISYMLHFLGSERHITGVDKVEEKVDVANNNFSRSNNMRFICADALQIEFEKQDAFLVTGIVAQLPLEEQRALVQKLLEALRPSGVLLLIAPKKTATKINLDELQRTAAQAGKSLHTSWKDGMLIGKIC